MEARDNDGRTPLLTAALFGNAVGVAELLGRGANIETPDHEGNSPARTALELNREAIFFRLLDEGADLETRDRRGRTMLWYIAGSDFRQDVYTRILSELLSRGVDVDARDDEGITPLKKAGLMGNVQFLQTVQSIRGAKSHGNM